MRKPFQGVINIIRFNWHFYLIACLGILCMFSIAPYIDPSERKIAYAFIILITTIISISLLVSFYVYDLSGLYSLSWMDHIDIYAGGNMINIHAGFDESSGLLMSKFPNASLTIFDFYNPVNHTEISIERARKAYPAFANTQAISTELIPAEDGFADTVFVILSAHEIRKEEERIKFFEELCRITKPGSNIIIAEHLRDIPNLLAYNIGAFHFLPKSAWLWTFEQSQFVISREIHITPFITTFVLRKNGNTP